MASLSFPAHPPTPPVPSETLSLQEHQGEEKTSIAPNVLIPPHLFSCFCYTIQIMPEPF